MKPICSIMFIRILIEHQLVQTWDSWEAFILRNDFSEKPTLVGEDPILIQKHLENTEFPKVCSEGNS
jgi:hypothetical protein